MFLRIELATRTPHLRAVFRRCGAGTPTITVIADGLSQDDRPCGHVEHVGRKIPGRCFLPVEIQDVRRRHVHHPFGGAFDTGARFAWRMKRRPEAAPGTAPEMARRLFSSST